MCRFRGRTLPWFKFSSPAASPTGQAAPANVQHSSPVWVQFSCAGCAATANCLVWHYGGSACAYAWRLVPLTRLVAASCCTVANAAAIPSGPPCTHTRPWEGGFIPMPLFFHTHHQGSSSQNQPPYHSQPQHPATALQLAPCRDTCDNACCRLPAANHSRSLPANILAV